MAAGVLDGMAAPPAVATAVAVPSVGDAVSLSQLQARPSASPAGAGDLRPVRSTAERPPPSVSRPVPNIPAPVAPVVNRRAIRTQSADLPAPRAVKELDSISPVAAATPLAAPAPNPPTPPPSASFLGALDTGAPYSYSPDIGAAIGSTHLMLALSTEVVIQDRSGSVLTNMPIDTFWAGVTSPNPAVYEPRIVYDTFEQRWIFVAVANYTNNPGLLLAVSQSSDPTQGWYRRFIDVDVNKPLYAAGPNVGFSANRVVLQANMFYKTNDGFYGSYIYALTKADLYAGGSGSPRRFELLDYNPANPNFSQGVEENAPVPAVTYDSGVTTNFFLGNLNGNFQEFGFIRVYSLGGTLGAETFSVAASPDPATLPAWEHYSTNSGFLPQYGTTDKIDAGDCRIQNVVMQNAQLWAAQTVFYPTNAPARSAVQWWAVTPGGRVNQVVTIEHPFGNYSYAYPSIAVNDVSEVLVGFSRFAAFEYPSALYAFQGVNDPSMYIRTETLLKAGEAPFRKKDSRGRIFWGAWSAAVLDPNSLIDMWTVQEYAAPPLNGTNRWGTWWGRVSPPVNLILTMTGAPSQVFQSAPFSYTLTVTNANFGLPASGVRITNTLPPGVTFISATASQGSCTNANGAVGCRLGTLNSASTATVTVTVRATVVGQIVNTALAVANGPDDFPSDNTASVTTQVLPSADLLILGAAAPNPVNADENVTWTITVTNAGGSSASGVTVTNTLPAGMTFVSASSSQGSCAANGSVVSCSLGVVPSQGRVTVTIVAGAGPGGLTANALAVVRTATTDADPSNNTTTIPVRVNAFPTLLGITDQSINENSGPLVLPFTVSDAETPAASLAVTASSSNPSLVPGTNIMLGGSGSNRTITLTPLPYQSGSATISRTVTDADGAGKTKTFVLTVLPINDPPTLDPISNVSINEDASPVAVPLAGIGSGAPNELQTLTVTASSSSPGIVANPTVNYTGGSSGSLTVTPAPNGFGTATITVRVNDGGLSNNITQRTFSVVVNPVNDPPTLGAISDVTTDEDTVLASVNLTGISGGPTNEADTISLAVSNSRPDLLTNVTVTYTSPAAAGTLTFATVTNAFGSAAITVTVNDGRGSNNLASRTVNVTVNPVNDRPTLGALADLNLNENAGPQTVSLTGISYGPTNENQAITITVTNLNAALVTNVAIAYASPDPAGTLTFTLVPYATGTATLWVAVSDGDPVNNSRSRFFTVTVSPVNDPPMLDVIPNVTLEEEAGPQTIVLTGISSGDPNESQTLTLSVTNSNRSLFSTQPRVTGYASPSNSGTLTFTPAADGFGTAAVTVLLTDDGSSNNVTTRTFSVNVTPVNDFPTLAPISNLTTNQDAGLLTVPLTGITTGASNENDTLAFSVSSSQPGLLTNFSFNYVSPSPTGTLTFGTVTNAVGAADITVTLDDNRGSNNLVSRTFSVTLNVVNHPPSLDPISDVATNEDTGPVLVPLTGIDSGAPGEIQSLAVTAVSGNTALIPNPIPVSYTSPGSGGSLSLMPLPDAFGTALITVAVNDGAASNNITTRTFTLTVVPVNDLPSISAIDPQGTDEDVPLVVPFTVSDLETPAGSLTLEALSSNEELILGGEVQFAGSGANRTAIIPALTNQFGGATLFITVMDADGGSAMTFFDIEVRPVNDPPTLSTIPTQIVNRGSTPPPISFSVTDIDSPVRNVVVSARSSDQALVPDANLVLGGSNPARTLQVTPAPGRVGTATLTVVATDGTATNQSSFTFVVNGPPGISTIADRATSEDVPTGPVAFSISDLETSAAALTLSASSSDTNVVLPGGITFGGAAADRTVNLLPVTNQSGVTLITLTVTDANGLSASTSFTLTVTPENDLPTLSNITDRNVNENATLGPISFSVADPDSLPSALIVTASSSNPSLVPDSALLLGGSGSSRTLTLTPAPGRSGSTTVTVSVVDANGGLANDTFVLTVTGVNDPPTISPPPNITMNEDSTTGPLPFVVSDPDTATATLTVTASSSNPTLLPNANLVVGGTDANRTITATPVTNQAGSATITLTVSDGSGGSTNTTFTVTVNAVNDPPTLNAISNVTTNEDAGLQTVSLSGLGAGATNESQTIAITATSSNPAIIPNPGVTYSSPNTTGTLTFTPVANASGTATITVTVNDGAPSNNLVIRTFTVTVNPGNDLPTISDIASQTTPEATPILVPFTISDLETPTYALILSATSSNLALVPANRLYFDGSSASRNLLIVPAPGQSGTSLITVTVSDGTNSASDGFLLTVSAVNDPPTLDPILDVATTSSTTVTLPLSGISSGAANESQGLTLTLTNNNTALFSTQPSVTYASPNSTGSLTFKIGSNRTGAAVVTVTVRDNGTPNMSFSQTFTIYSRASANTPPTISAIATQTVSENVTAGPIAFTIGDATTAANLLAVSAVSSNLALVPANGFSFGGSGANRTVTITPAPNQFGTNLITVGVLDDAFGYNRTNFLLIINPVNSLPTLAPIANVAINENTSTAPIPLVVSDVETRAASLTVTATSSDQTLVPNANIILGGDGTNRVLVITPAANRSGSALITVAARDGSGTNTTSFTLTVNGVNDPPAISALTDLTLNEDTSGGPVAFTVGDAETAAASLSLTAASSNTSLLPTNGISFGGSGSNRTVSITPLASQFGTSQVTVTVTDAGGASASSQFRLTVNPVNDPPTLGAVANVSINQNAGPQNVALAGIASGAANESQPLYITASSSNPALIPAPTVTYASPGATGTLTLLPRTNASGNATITVTVSDAQPANSVTTRTFTVTVNGPPIVAAIPPQGTREDTPTPAIPFVVGDDATAAGALTLGGTSSSQSLVPNAAITFGGSGSNRTVTVTPAPNQSGWATITVTATDAGGMAASRSFTVVVEPLDDLPTLDSISNLVLNEDGGSQIVSLTGITSGAPNEAQALTVAATSSNPALIPDPGVSYTSPDTSGLLTVAPVPEGYGTATITVRVSDGPGPSNAVTSTFTVTVNPVNDLPTLDPIGALTIGAGAGPQSVSLAGITAGAPNETQPLAITAVSSNTSVIPNPSVTYHSPDATGTLQFTPVPGATGSALIRVNVNDGAPSNNLVTRTFSVTVTGGVAQARLRIALEPGRTIALFWPAQMADYAPEGRDSFSGGGAWTRVPGTPERVGDELKLTALATGEMQCFRLASAEQPRLRLVLQSDGEIALLWPASATGYVPESKDSFDGGTSWTSVPGTPQVEGNEFKLTLSLGGPTKFFRLRHP
jgi:uncharacterized repeat protein (TIGR01451 family)